jgi:hypothetical protein
MNKIKWGVWVTDINTFMVESYKPLGNQEYEAMYTEFDTRKAAAKEANDFNTLWRGRSQVFTPKKLPKKYTAKVDKSP